MRFLFCVSCTEGGCLCCKFCFDSLVAIEPYSKIIYEINLEHSENQHADNHTNLPAFSQDPNNQTDQVRSEQKKTTGKSQLTIKIIDKPYTGDMPSNKDIERVKIENSVGNISINHYKPPEPIVIRSLRNCQPNETNMARTLHTDDELMPTKRKLSHDVVLETQRKSSNDQFLTTINHELSPEGNRPTPIKYEFSPEGNRKSTALSINFNDITEGEPFPILPPKTL